MRRLIPILVTIAVLGGLIAPNAIAGVETARSQGIIDDILPPWGDPDPPPSAQPPASAPPSHPPESTRPPSLSSNPGVPPSRPAPGPPPTSAPRPPYTSTPAPPPPPAQGSETPRGRLPAGPTSPPETDPGPGRAWTLTSSNLKLIGSRYHGYAEQDVQGRKVTTLHFTVDKLEITDLVQRGDLQNGKIVKAAGAPRSVSTVSKGPIHLYTQKLTGTLAVAGYPIVPITLSPNSLALPNLDLSFLQLPDLTFKDAVVHNVYLGGGNLHIPGATITVE